MTVHFGNKYTPFGALEIGSGGISLHKRNIKLVIPSNHAWAGVPAPLSMSMIVIVDHENRYIIVFSGPLSLSYFNYLISGPVFECVIVVPLNKTKLKYEYVYELGKPLT